MMNPTKRGGYEPRPQWPQIRIPPPIPEGQIIDLPTAFRGEIFNDIMGHLERRRGVWVPTFAHEVATEPRLLQRIQEMFPGRFNPRIHGIRLIPHQDFQRQGYIKYEQKDLDELRRLEYQAEAAAAARRRAREAEAAIEAAEEAEWQRQLQNNPHLRLRPGPNEIFFRHQAAPENNVVMNVARNNDDDVLRGGKKKNRSTTRKLPGKSRKTRKSRK